MPEKKFTKYQIATAIAILFHVIGLVGILFVHKELFIATSFYHLLLMAILVIYTHGKISLHLVLFFVVCFAVGMGVEWFGTSTGELFGNYQYGTVMGPAFKKVPYIIGVNWFIIIYCCGTTVSYVFNRLYEKVKDAVPIRSNILHSISIIVDGALLAVITDYFLEPAAIKLGYWQWLGDGQIPFYNYTCWFVVSAVLLAIFKLLKIYCKNIFAVNLLLMQILFFLIISTFL